jgi:dihydrofolate reductase
MIRFYFACSVDGFIAARDGSVDFLTPYQSPELGFDRFLAQISVVVMGRKTYETLLSFGAGAWPYGTTRGIVLSSNDVKSRFLNVERMNISPQALHERLAATEIGGDIWIEGGRTMGSFLAAGLVDRIEQHVVPVILGDGIPMFGGLASPVALHTIETRIFSNEVIKHTYARL